MTHIRSKFFNTGGTHGEFCVSDLIVFSSSGKLGHVAVFWEAVVAQSLLLDRAHATALSDWAGAAKQAEDPEYGIEATWRADVLKLSDQYLIRANIFLLLLSFFEFAVLEVYKLNFGQYPLVERPGLFKDVIEPLKTAGVVGDPPELFVREIAGNRDEIRNAFVHGRWNDLKDPTERIDLYEAFCAVSVYFGLVEDKLREKGIEV